MYAPVYAVRGASACFPASLVMEECGFARTGEGARGAYGIRTVDKRPSRSRGSALGDARDRRGHESRLALGLDGEIRAKT